MGGVFYNYKVMRLRGFMYLFSAFKFNFKDLPKIFSYDERDLVNFNLGREK